MDNNQTTQPTISPPMPPQQPAMLPTTGSQSKLKPLMLSLLAVILLGAVGFGVYSWQHKKLSDANAKVSSLQSQVSSLQSQVNKLSQTTKSSSTSSTSSSQSNIPALTSFTSKDGKFSLQYPSSWVVTASCSSLDNQFNAGSNTSSAGACNTNSGVSPEITVLDTTHPCILPSSGGSTRQTIVSGVKGQEFISTDGTTVEYCVASPSVPGLSYEATYTQSAGNPNVSSDFNSMVTGTLKFN